MTASSRFASLCVGVILASAFCAGTASATTVDVNEPAAACAAPYSRQVVDAGLPSALSVCSDEGGLDRHPPIYLVSNHTSNVWSVRSDQAGVPLLAAWPRGEVSARVAAFRWAQDIDQSTSRLLPSSWIIEPGTSALIQPGATYGLLEVDRSLQGSWTNYLAMESAAQRAGTALPNLIRREPYARAVKSCVGFGFTAFDLTPGRPTTTQTMLDDLSATARGLQCGADLDLTDRVPPEARVPGDPAPTRFNRASLIEELSRSAGSFDDILAKIGKVLQRIPNHV